MQLTLWTYEGPPHIGAMRVATAMTGLHYVLHAPQGDTYADLLFTMIERRDARPPVTYTTFRAQDLGRDTAELFKTSVAAAYARFQPQAMIVGASCTAELIQDDPGGLAKALDLPIPVIPLELPAYQKKENWGASETFYRLVRALAGPPAPRPAREPGRRPLCNILGTDGAGLPPPRRPDRDPPAARCPRHRGQRRGAARRIARRSRPARGRRLQRRALSRDRAVRGGIPEEELRAAVHADRADRRRRHPPVRRRGRGARRNRSGARPRRPRLAPALVLPLGRFDLSHGQARLRVRRRDPRPRHRPGRGPGTRLHRRRPRHLQPRIRPRGPRRGGRARHRGADHRRLPRRRGGDPRGRAGTRARHPDGAPRRQAARHPLRGDLRPGPRPGLPGPLRPADGLRGRQRPVRHPGPSADDGPRGAPPRHVPGGSRIPRRRRPVASRRQAPVGGPGARPARRAGRHPPTPIRVDAPPLRSRPPPGPPRPRRS